MTQASAAPETRAKHTPWRAHENEVLGVGEIVIADVAVDINTSLAQAKRHARLIAAAPELLEMTKLLERSIVYEIKKSEREGDDEGARCKFITLAQARAAIAKAEARS